MTSKHWYSALKSHQSFFSHICLRGLWRSATDQLLLSLTDKYEQVIRSCDLEGCHALTDRSLGRLAECPKLRTMVVSMCKFTPQASWPSHLEHLVLNDCPQLDTSALQLIVEHNPDLRSLSLGYCAQILDDSLEVVALNCPKLMRLDVCFCLQVRDPGVMSVAESCHELRVVLLNGCEGLTDSSLMSLLDNCPHLSHATVCRTSSPAVSLEMASKIRSIHRSESNVLCEGDALYERHFGCAIKDPNEGKVRMRAI